MVTYGGGNGESFAEAIVIQGAANTNEGVAGEYQYLSKKFGRRGIDWELVAQRLRIVEDKYYDQMEVRLSNGTQKTIYFNITDFFGKK